MVDAITATAIRNARAYLRDNVEANMTSTVRISRQQSAADVSVNSAGSISVNSESIIYEGMARMHNASGPVTYTIGEEVQFFSSGRATIPVDVDGDPVDVWVNDLLLVTGSDDPVLAGRRFRVVDVEVAGMMSVSRSLQLVGIQHYSGWVDDSVRVASVGAVPEGLPPEWSV
jgi:hypothetical protein